MTTALLSRPYTPLYDSKEIRSLLKFWLEGSLDGIAPRNKVSAGVVDCDRPSLPGLGYRSLPLLERYTCEEVNQVFADMGRDLEPAPTHAVLILLEQRYTLDSLARAMGLRDAHEAQGVLCDAYDDFARRLLDSSRAFSHRLG